MTRQTRAELGCGPDLWTPSSRLAPDTFMPSSPAGCGREGALASYSLLGHHNELAWEARSWAKRPSTERSPALCQLWLRLVSLQPGMRTPPFHPHLTGRMPTLRESGVGSLCQPGDRLRIETQRSCSKPLHWAGRGSLLKTIRTQLPSLIYLILTNILQLRKQIERLSAVHKVTVLGKWGESQDSSLE